MMKTTLIHLKKWVRNLSSKIKQHEFCVYGYLSLIVLAFSFYFLGQIKSTSKLIEKDKEIIGLNTVIQEYHTMFWEQQEAMKDHHNDMYEAGETIQSQKIFIENVILYLKRIGHWPPKVSPKELRESKGSEA